MRLHLGLYTLFQDVIVHANGKDMSTLKDLTKLQLHKNYVTYLCYSCCKEASWDARQARHTAKQNSPSAEGKG